ncbi:hypothetical protein K7432_008787 [Basidiobolus ranarum]|uniref:Uncharacterized protein n=1 Tax=Basidiobolus ranarum TaxID=34480 RepID=A0ABR2VY50_9FUNG
MGFETNHFGDELKDTETGKLSSPRNIYRTYHLRRYANDEERGEAPYYLYEPNSTPSLEIEPTDLPTME